MMEVINYTSSLNRDYIAMFKLDYSILIFLCMIRTIRMDVHICNVTIGIPFIVINF